VVISITHLSNLVNTIKNRAVKAVELSTDEGPSTTQPGFHLDSAINLLLGKVTRLEFFTNIRTFLDKFH
jgi:hypothetical protein